MVVGSRVAGGRAGVGRAKKSASPGWSARRASRAVFGRVVPFTVRAHLGRPHGGHGPHGGACDRGAGQQGQGHCARRYPTLGALSTGLGRFGRILDSFSGGPVERRSGRPDAPDPRRSGARRPRRRTRASSTAFATARSGCSSSSTTRRARWRCSTARCAISRSTAAGRSHHAPGGRSVLGRCHYDVYPDMKPSTGATPTGAAWPARRPRSSRSACALARRLGDLAALGSAALV